MDQEDEEESLLGFVRPRGQDKWTDSDRPGHQLFQSGRLSLAMGLDGASNDAKEEEEESPEVVLLGRLCSSTGSANYVSCCWAHWSSKAGVDASVAAAAAAATVDEAAAAAAAWNCASVV